jgi:very-short-patch-repair endonuclease
LGYGALMSIPHARHMRKEMTPAEWRLWKALRELDISGTHFRRQMPIGPYIADFCCHQAKLVIEIDGAQHTEDANIGQDETRTQFLQARGYRVLRFWNHDVMRNAEGVVLTVLDVLKGRLPTGGGDR